MYWKPFYPPLFQFIAQRNESVHIRNAGFEPVLDDLRKKVRSGSKYEYGQRDTRPTQLHTFQRQRNGQIVSTFRLHHRSEFYRTVSVCICLDKHQQLSRRLEQGPEIAVVASARREAELQSGKIIFCSHTLKLCLIRGTKSARRQRPQSRLRPRYWMPCNS